MRIYNFRFVIAAITLFLFFLPFFWLKPGEMDLGGDSSRLFLYDPLSYLKNNSFFSIEPAGVRNVLPNQYHIPFLSLLILINSIFHSPYILISLLNSLKIAGSFLFIYLIVKEFLEIDLKKNRHIVIQLSAIFSGLFYVLSPSLVVNMPYALLPHNQVFLNPLIFYLLLRYVLTYRQSYLWWLIGVTILFSPNFSFITAPSFFSFFPLSILFLLLYVGVILKQNIPWLGLFLGSLLLVGLHMFHLYPEARHILQPGNYLNSRLFDKKSILENSIQYFNAVLPLGKVGANVLTNSPFTLLWTSFAGIAVVLCGFLFNEKKKIFLLSAIFYLITLYLLSANITHVGVVVYRKLFYIPGFGMFRNFIGQWQFIYTFFYSILFGQSLFIIYSKLRLKHAYALSVIFLIFFILNSSKFFNGEIIRVTRTDSKKSVIITLDTKYRQTLDFIKSLPDDGKILSLPFADFAYEVVKGGNDGIYVGPSMVAFLTGKNDFVGYTNMIPFPETFFKLAREKNYEGLKRLFAILNIRYIFHSSDPDIYDPQSFGPYNYAKQSLPSTQKEYSEFISHFAKEIVYSNDTYKVYKIDSSSYLPRIYIPVNAQIYKNDVNDWEGENKTFFATDTDMKLRKVYLLDKECDKILYSGCPSIVKEAVPLISFKRINPITYRVNVTNASSNYFLILSDIYDADWKISLSSESLDNEKIQERFFNGAIQEYKHSYIVNYDNIKESLFFNPLVDNTHFRANGYANGWYIRPKDVGNRKNYQLTIHMTGQKYFYQGAILSIVSLIIYAGWGCLLLKKIVLKKG
jgi:hypothetical protein